MKRKEIIFGVVLSVFILVSTPVFANNIQSDIQSSNNDTLIIENDDPKELLFQTIGDMTINEDIQNLIENSEFEITVNKETFRILFTKLFLQNPKLLISLLFTRPILPKDYLNYAYNIGGKLSSSLSSSEMKSITDCFHINNQGALDEVIEKLSDLNCGCNKDNSEFVDWDFPIICDILGGILVLCVFLIYVLNLGKIIYTITYILGDLFNCSWVW